MTRHEPPAPRRAAARLARLSMLLLVLFPWLVCPAAPAAAQIKGEVARALRDGRRPRLVVVLSIDQFRADYLRRLADLYLPPSSGGKVGGFRYLMANGADFLDARYRHFPLYTGPGHATILTGGHPYKHGIVSNNWWDRRARREVYCVDDPRYKVVGAAPGSRATPMGPLNLRSSTVGDELKLATAGRAKVVTLSLKDRAAILLGGHAQDVSLWFDTAGGRWISSTAFCRDGRLPAWAEALNDEAIPTKALGQEWRPVVAPEALAARAFAPVLPENANPGGIGRAFPHRVPAEPTAASYTAFTHTPAANAYVFASAKRAVTAERLGQRENVPDLLAINLATNDYLGHAFGPYSPEALDLSVQTDRQLSDFLNFLNETVPGGLKNVVVALTADHGVGPVPEDSVRLNLLPTGRVPSRAIPDAVQKGLSARYGAGKWIAESEDGRENGGFVEGFVYLSEPAVASALAGGKAKSRGEIEETAAEAVRALDLPGVYDVYGLSRVLRNALPDTPMAKFFAKGLHPRLSGDLVVVNEPGYLTGSSAASHGTAYAYDTHVPLLLCGFGVSPGAWADAVEVADLAPTLCLLLGIEYPSGCDGVPLRQAFR